MRTFFAASALALAIAAPAAAQELSFSAGATVASKYVSSGAEAATKGGAFQPWVQADIAGFYAGAWGSNVAEELNNGNTWETDLYIGYAGEYAGVAYDVSYTHFYYNKNDSLDAGEWAFSLGYDVTEQLNLSAKVKLDPEAREYTNTSLTAAYAVNDVISLEATYGTKSHSRNDYWSIGGSYALNDQYAVSLTYKDHDIKGTKGEHVVLALDYTFSFK